MTQIMKKKNEYLIKIKKKYWFKRKREIRCSTRHWIRVTLLGERNCFVKICLCVRF